MRIQRKNRNHKRNGDNIINNTTSNLNEKGIVYNAIYDGDWYMNNDCLMYEDRAREDLYSSGDDIFVNISPNGYISIDCTPIFLIASIPNETSILFTINDDGMFIIEDNN